MTTVQTGTLTRVGDRLAFVLDEALLNRLGITAETPLRLSEAGGTLLLTPERDPAREAKFVAVVETMSKRYEGTLRRLAE